MSKLDLIIENITRVTAEIAKLDEALLVVPGEEYNVDQRINDMSDVARLRQVLRYYEQWRDAEKAKPRT
jgi:ferritin